MRDVDALLMRSRRFSQRKVRWIVTLCVCAGLLAVCGR